MLNNWFFCIIHINILSQIFSNTLSLLSETSLLMIILDIYLHNRCLLFLWVTQDYWFLQDYLLLFRYLLTKTFMTHYFFLSFNIALKMWFIFQLL